MVRFATILLASMLFAAPVQPQVGVGNATSPWSVSEERKPARSFDVADISGDPNAADEKGSLIVAGRELAPNTTFGVGLFGEKAERPIHRPSTNRDHAMPRSRKAAVGFALRF
jgi:hypothetical protein